MTTPEPSFEELLKQIRPPAGAPLPDFTIIHEVDLGQPVTVDGVETTIGAIEDPTTRAHFGYGHFPSHIAQRNRRILTHPDGLPWPYEPESCRRADNTVGIWCLTDGEPTELACTGCGLDCT